jgi:glycine cleavage system transcriptional repressor
VKQYYVTSAVGKDRPGFINQITRVIYASGGNVEMQRAARMADEFAAIILFSLEGSDPAGESALQGLLALQSDDFKITARAAVGAGDAAIPGCSFAEVTASGADQPGIIDVVTHLLFKENINVESMNYNVDSAPMTGQQLFRMEARLAIPEGVDVETLKEKLRELEDQLNFDILFTHPVCA